MQLYGGNLKHIEHSNTTKVHIDFFCAAKRKNFVLLCSYVYKKFSAKAQLSFIETYCNSSCHIILK